VLRYYSEEVNVLNWMVYALTDKGKKLASLLREVEQIVEDTWNSSTQVMQIH